MKQRAEHFPRQNYKTKLQFAQLITTASQTSKSQILIKQSYITCRSRLIQIFTVAFNFVSFLKTVLVVAKSTTTTKQIGGVF